MSTDKMPGTKIVLGGARPTPAQLEAGNFGELVRFSYLNAFEPKLNKNSGKMTRGVTALIPKSNTALVKQIREAIEELQREAWTSKGKRVPPKAHFPLRDGDNDTKQNGDPLDEAYKGHWFINCSTDDKRPLPVVGTSRDSKGKLIRLTADQVKSGDWGRIGVRLQAFTKGDGGIACYVQNIQLVQEGEALAGSSSPEDDFSDFDDDDNGAFD